MHWVNGYDNCYYIHGNYCGTCNYAIVTFSPYKFLSSVKITTKGLYTGVTLAETLLSTSYRIINEVYEIIFTDKSLHQVRLVGKKYNISNTILFVCIC